MEDPKDLRDQLRAVISKMGDTPDVAGIRAARVIIVRLRETLIHDVNKQKCFRAMQRLNNTFKFKTDRKKKELVNEAWSKLSGMIVPEKRFKRLRTD